MKKVIKWILIVVAAVIVLTVFKAVIGYNTYSKTPEAMAYNDSIAKANKIEAQKPVVNMNDSALIEIRKEEVIKEAIITDAQVLYASVFDDGTRRDGFAEYLCQILKEHNATVREVKVVKFGSTKDPKRDNAYGILLGEAFCK